MKENFITRNFFNGLAPEWHKYGHEEKQKISQILSKLDLEENHSILDLGCGTGILFPFIIKLTEGRAKIFAIDFAQQMTQKATEKKDQPVNVICGDVQQLPFHKNKFHRIIAFQVFPHIHQKHLALKECWRVLKPYGELGIFHLHSSDEINSIHAQVGGSVKNHILPAEDIMCHILHKANFKVKTSIDKPGQYFISAMKINF